MVVRIPLGSRPTPAGAGSTVASSGASSRSSAYPRWRGEHILLAHRKRYKAGLPPLARGAQTAAVHRLRTQGPTPAGAGSTPRAASGRASGSAYPRWRGEHQIAANLAWAVSGLPPLARGARGGSHSAADAAGPTPAGAGSTPACRTVPSRGRAYPRWRGEHAAAKTEALAAIGLPPLARGARRRRLHHRVRAGPTPAGAGSTRSRAACRPSPRAYPRWRGEHVRLHVGEQFDVGLPPLARGARTTRR